MRFVLIDTNCLVDLLVDEAEEKGLRILEHCISERKINLLVPVKLQEEWMRQKNNRINDIRAGINVGINAFDRPLQKRLKKQLEHLEDKAKRIDRLLAGGKICSATKHVHADVGNRKTKELPPFHILKNSDGDAYIYFSAINYVRSRRISKIIFITHDKKAFSDPKDELQLHQSLVVTGIDVHYLYGVGPGTNYLKTQFGFKDDYTDADADYDAILYNFVDTKKLNWGERVFEALNAYHDQLPYIPTHLLAKTYPFKINNLQTGYTYHSSFQINTNNEALARFFSNIQIGDKNKISFVDKKKALVTKQKAFVILERLNQNLIFNISSIGADSSADIRLTKELPPTIQDLWNQFDFLKAHQMLVSRPTKNTGEMMRQAYLHFQFGYFDEAVLLFYRVYDISKSNGKKILEFLSLYNLKRLKGFINSYYLSKNQETISTLKKVERVSIRKYRVSYEQESAFVQECIAWIADNDFHQQAFIDLSETVEKVRDHYHIQLRSGYSSNSNCSNLISRFLEIDQFLELNCIVFNTYSNYEDITAKLSEGLMMMHSFNEKQPGRIAAVKKVLLHKLIMYGKRETIVKYYKRLHLKGIVEDESPHSMSVLDIALRFFGDYPQLKEVLAKTEDKNPYFFWEKYFKIAENLLFMLTVTISTADYTSVTSKLLAFIDDDAASRRINVGHLADFVREKGRFIQTTVLKKFLVLSVKNSRLHDFSLFDAFVTQKLRNHPGVLLNSKESLHNIEEYFLHRCPKCNSVHDPSVLGALYQLLSTSAKKKLRSVILQQLANQFDEDLYYNAAMYDVIHYEAFFDSFIARCPVLKPAAGKSAAYGYSEANHHQLSKLINLAFKFNIEIAGDPRIQQHRGLSNYYDWLLNMNEYDYKKFDPLWILEYQTTAYYKVIFSSAKVKDCLIKYLKRTKHPVLSDLLIRYGCITEDEV